MWWRSAPTRVLWLTLTWRVLETRACLETSASALVLGRRIGQLVWFRALLPTSRVLATWAHVSVLMGFEISVTSAVSAWAGWVHLAVIAAFWVAWATPVVWGGSSAASAPAGSLAQSVARCIWPPWVIWAHRLSRRLVQLALELRRFWRCRHLRSLWNPCVFLVL